MASPAASLPLPCSNSVSHKSSIISSSLNYSDSHINSSDNTYRSKNLLCFASKSASRGAITQLKAQVGGACSCSSNLRLIELACSKSLRVENDLAKRSTYISHYIYNDKTNYSRKIGGLYFASKVGGRLSGRLSSWPTAFVACSSSNPSLNSDPNRDDSESDSLEAGEQELAEDICSQRVPSTPLPFTHFGSLEESWLLIDNKDVPTVVSTLPITERYAPRRLLEFVTKKLSSQLFSLAQLRSTLYFWQKKETQEDHSFLSYTFEEKKGVSQLHQWTATELTLQHAQLSKIARDVLYLIYACSLLGLVRVLEAVVATFSLSPPRYAKLLDAMSSIDFFTVAFLAHNLRKPIINILRIDAVNLDEVIQLKAQIWDEMHKFYERQWKVVATLGMGRLLALVAQTLPSTNEVTKCVKMGWNMLLALPIF